MSVVDIIESWGAIVGATEGRLVACDGDRMATFTWSDEGWQLGTTFTLRPEVPGATGVVAKLRQRADDWIGMVESLEF